MKYIDTPQSLVEKWVGMVPGLWGDLDLIQNSKDAGPGWPDECAIPIGAAAAAMIHRGEDTDTAERMGATIRAAEKRYSAAASSGTGPAKRPHARRGHWHHYWHGPRNARQLILKWTAPTFLHPEAGREENVVAIKVK